MDAMQRLFIQKHPDLGQHKVCTAIVKSTQYLLDHAVTLFFLSSSHTDASSLIVMVTKLVRESL